MRLYPLYSRDSGFTLLELLVVLLLLGIIISFASLSLGQRSVQRQLAENAERIAQLVQLATEEAQLNQEEWGLHISQEQYQFARLESVNWQTISSGLFKPRQIPQGMSIHLEQSDALLKISEPAENVPQILILSSGELTSFQLRLGISGQTPHFLLRGEWNGKLHLERIDEVFF